MRGRHEEAVIIWFDNLPWVESPSKSVWLDQIVRIDGMS